MVNSDCSCLRSFRNSGTLIQCTLSSSGEEDGILDSQHVVLYMCPLLYPNQGVEKDASIRRSDFLLHHGPRYFLRYIPINFFLLPSLLPRDFLVTSSLSSRYLLIMSSSDSRREPGFRSQAVDSCKALKLAFLTRSFCISDEDSSTNSSSSSSCATPNTSSIGRPRGTPLVSGT